MNRMRTLFLAVPAVLLALSPGCAGPGKGTCPPPAPAARNQDVLEGYALLYALASREQDVDRLFADGGAASPESRRVVEEIAQVNRDILQSLERWARESPSLGGCGAGTADLDAHGRALARDLVAWQLLLSGNGECAKTFLLAQHQTLIYESSLLKAIHGTQGCARRRAETGAYAERVDRITARLAGLILIEP